MAIQPTQTALFLPRYFGEIVFDAVLEETHTTELEVTSHPIESGASINDHVFLKPKQLSIQAYVSNHDIQGRTNDATSGSLQNDGLQGIQRGQSGIVSGSTTARMSAAYEAILLTQELGLLIDVQTGLQLYENMAVESLVATNGKNNDSSIIFKCELIQLTITESQYVRHPQSKFYTRNSKDQRGKIVKTKRNQVSQRTSNKSESKIKFGQINSDSTATTAINDRTVRRKQSALCKLLPDGSICK